MLIILRRPVIAVHDKECRSPRDKHISKASPFVNNEESVKGLSKYISCSKEDP